MTKTTDFEHILRRDDLRGCWVAVDPSEYDEAGRAVAGSVVDADADLGSLCGRLADTRSRCAIVFCEAGDPR